MDKGFLKKELDQKITELFREYTFRNTDAYKKSITLRHLPAMSSGLM